MAIALSLIFGIALTAITVVTVTRGAAWFWALKQWVRVSLMLSLGLVGGLGAWFAARDAERIEPVWLDVATGVTPWAVLPIRVRMAADLDTYTPAAQQAMRMWNESAGCQLFKEESPESTAWDVRLLFLKSEPCDHAPTVLVDANIAASTYFCDGGSVDIVVNRLDEMQVAYVVFAHELGHALGLAHDPPPGLMAPFAASITLVFPSEKDVRAIRARYCGGH